MKHFKKIYMTMYATINGLCMQLYICLLHTNQLALNCVFAHLNHGDHLLFSFGIYFFADRMEWGCKITSRRSQTPLLCNISKFRFCYFQAIWKKYSRFSGYLRTYDYHIYGL